mmetsp:Transcript_65678/g.155580  ORF Transcript_65678/g.155580 Transcript_65678/m.155580 type:complete len:164 (-) Transcript_65678:448-939(-)
MSGPGATATPRSRLSEPERIGVGFGGGFGAVILLLAARYCLRLRSRRINRDPPPSHPAGAALPAPEPLASLFTTEEAMPSDTGGVEHMNPSDTVVEGFALSVSPGDQVEFLGQRGGSDVVQGDLSPDTDGTNVVVLAPSHPPTMNPPTKNDEGRQSMMSADKE